MGQLKALVLGLCGRQLSWSAQASVSSSKGWDRLNTDLRTSTWLQAASQTTDIFMTFGGDLATDINIAHVIWTTDPLSRCMDLRPHHGLMTFTSTHPSPESGSKAQGHYHVISQQHRPLTCCRIFAHSVNPEIVFTENPCF